VPKIYHSAFSVGNKLEDPLQKVASSSPVMASKNTSMPLSKALLEGGMDTVRRGSVLKG